MPQLSNKRPLFAIVAWILIAALLATIRVPASHAAGAHPAEIRVALLISTRGTVPAVTLESAAAWTAAVHGAASPAIAAEGGRPVRFSPSGHALIVRETEDYGAALEAYRSVAPHGHAEILADALMGRTVYQVRLAGFANRAEAEAAASRVPFAGAGTLKLAGPLYASAGTFATAEEAEQLAGAMRQQGIRAWLSVHPDLNGFGSYSVWIGESPSRSELEQAMAEALSLYPGAALHPVDGALPYLLRRTDAAPGLDGPIDHYRFNRSGQEVRVTAGEGAPISVHERYGRSYRGALALSVFEEKLAVINELPLEQYLYSVVGSELPSSWPLEALKAQAVAARTYALKQGMKYRIAHVSDTTYDQAYRGIEAETPETRRAVEETRGEVLVDAHGLIEPFYASNHGGRSADPSEVWTGDVSYAKSVTSPDEIAERDKPDWYRIMLADGTSGYIRSDFAILTDATSKSGLPIIEVTGDNVNIRRAPRVDNTDNPAVAQANRGERYVLIGRDVESNPYSWIRGPYTAEQLKSTIHARAAGAVQGELATLEVTARGPSGRVTEVSANGKPVALSYPDQYRSAFNGLPSTLFAIEETGRYTVLAAFGVKREFPESSGRLSVLSAEGTAALSGNEFYIMDSEGDIRAATVEPRFRFIGHGYGHGLGMSQYGALALAEAGYDYQAILLYYYDGVRIVKE